MDSDIETRGPIAGGAHDISENDILEWGELSKEDTVTALKTLGQQVIGMFREKAGQEVESINADTISGLASVVEREIPFFHQGSGVGTIPRQIEHLNGLRPQLASPISEETRRKLMRGLDCKLPTAVLGYALHEIANSSGQAVMIYFLTHGRSSHPSLMVEIENGDQGKEVYKIDFQTRRDRSHIEAGERKILPPAIFRENTENYVIISNPNEEEQTRYRGHPYISHDLNWKSLRQLDVYFIES